MPAAAWEAYSPPPPGAGSRPPPRAALQALVFALDHTEGPTTIKPDCDYVVKGWRTQRWRLPTGPNADLWAQVGLAIRRRAGEVAISKVTAHLSREAAIAHRVDLQDFCGARHG